ncbi:MAG: S8 family serine peptidase [Bacteroidales bacterium]
MYSIVKYIFLIQLFSIVSSLYSQPKTSTPWYYRMPGETVAATGIDSAHKLLQNIIPEEVVVAVIDAGVDVSHISLTDKLWINKDEVPENGLDDDNNGYSDDLHGWNFLGNAEGENIRGAPYEYVRIYDTLRHRFDSSANKPSDFPKDPYFDLYQEVSEKYKKAIAKKRQRLKYYNLIIESYRKADEILKDHFGNSDYNIHHILELQPERPEVKWASDFYKKLHQRDINKSLIESRVRVIQAEIETKLNAGYNPRKLIGDNPANMEKVIYGNNDYRGGTASHGTAVAGIIGASQVDGRGIQGIAPHVRIMVLRAVPGGDEWDKDIALAIRYAVDNGADIINGSFGKMYSPQKNMVDSAIRYAEQNGVLLVVGAGNDGKNNDIRPNYPSPYYNNGERATNLITTGACTNDSLHHLAASFSNYGKESVDLFAPGVDIPALNTNNRFRTISGTSAAAPVVTGIAAMIKTYYPSIQPHNLRKILIESVTDYSQVNVFVPGSDNVSLPFKRLCKSSGVINAVEAVKLTKKLYRQNKL